MPNSTQAALGQLGMQTAGGIISQGMGMLLGNYNDRRQRMQQDKLWQMEMKNRKEMTDYEMEKQYEMWQKTNYAAQMEQLKKANLNPALLYGMGGQGGFSTGNASGQVSSAEAPKGGGEMQAMMGLTQNAMMNAAQIELIKAQTEKTKTETTKTAGVDTELTKTQIGSLTQGMEESKAKTALIQVDTTIKDLEKQILSATKEDQIQVIEWGASKVFRELQIADDAQYVSHATRLTRVDAATADLANTTMRTMLMGAQKTLVGAETKLVGAQTDKTVIDTEKSKMEIMKMINDMQRDWQKLRIEEQEMYIKSYAAKVGAAAIPAYLMTDIVKALGGIFAVSEVFKQTGRVPVQGFGRGNNPK